MRFAVALGLHDLLQHVPACATLGIVTRETLAGEVGQVEHPAVYFSAVAEELRDDLAVPVHAPRLVEDTLVVVEAEPLHALEDRVHGFGRGALEVGALDAQDEHAVVATRVGPAEERCAHAPDVQHAGGARGEAGADGGHGAGSRGTAAHVGNAEGSPEARTPPKRGSCSRRCVESSQTMRAFSRSQDRRGQDRAAPASPAPAPARRPGRSVHSAARSRSDCRLQGIRPPSPAS